MRVFRAVGRFVWFIGRCFYMAAGTVALASLLLYLFVGPKTRPGDLIQETVQATNSGTPVYSGYKAQEPRRGNPGYEIHVRGSAGTPFQGSYMVFGSGGAGSHSVSGVTPEVYTVEGQMVSASFQKKEQYGTLEVSIIKDGLVLKTEQTTAAYGVVTAATR